MSDDQPDPAAVAMLAATLVEGWAQVVVMARGTPTMSRTQFLLTYIRFARPNRTPRRRRLVAAGVREARRIWRQRKRSAA